MPSTVSSPEAGTSPCSVFTPGIPTEPGKVIWTGLRGDSFPLILANAVEQHDGPLVVITPDMKSAELLHEQV